MHYVLLWHFRTFVVVVSSPLFFPTLLSLWLRPPNASILLPCHMGPVTLSPSLKLSYALGPFSDCETHAFTQPTYTHVHKN